MSRVRQTVFDFKIERTDETLTAHGGLALMAEYQERIGLTSWVDQYLPAPGSNRGYAPSVFVTSSTLMLQAGGRTLEDLRELKQECGLMALIGQEKIPDPDTMGDWLRRMGQGWRGLLGLGKVRDRINQHVMKGEAITEYTLDADAAQIEAEKRDARWTYKGVRGYMPMIGFLFENGLCLEDEFREGNVAPQTKQNTFYRRCKKRMPKGKRIGFYRADSASYGADLVNHLEKDHVIWAITADQDAAVKKLIRGIAEDEWKEPTVGCGYQVAETVHTMGRTEKAFRLIVKREKRICQGDLFEAGEVYFYHAVGSNWRQEKKNALEVLAWHNQRGSAENFNKEIKLGFGLEQMPCGEFRANAIFFRLGIIAYNLFMGFKRLRVLSDWAHHTISTFRWKLIQVAGRIVRHAGRVILKLSVEADKLVLFRRIRQACFEQGGMT